MAYSSTFSLGAHSKDADFFDLFPLYNDIASLPSCTLNVHWRTQHEENEKVDEEEIVHKVLRLFPRPKTRHLMQLYNALNTTYHQSIYRETPRFHGIQFVDIINNAQLAYKRDMELHRIYEKVRESTTNKKQNVIKIHSRFKECSQQFKNAMLAFLAHNNQYSLNPVIVQNEEESWKFDDLLEMFYIQRQDVADYHGQLIGQRGLRAKQKINAYVVLGQYFGNEITENVYDTMFGHTSAEVMHGQFVFEVEIATKTEKIRFVVDPLPLRFDRNRCIDVEFRGCKLMFVNDCRKDVESMELTETDEHLCNVEFVHCDLNGWRQIYVITTKQIECGQQLYGFYGQELGEYFKVNADFKERCKELKDRLDARHPILPRLFPC